MLSWVPYYYAVGQVIPFNSHIVFITSSIKIHIQSHKHLIVYMYICQKSYKILYLTISLLVKEFIKRSVFILGLWQPLRWRLWTYNLRRISGSVDVLGGKHSEWPLFYLALIRIHFFSLFKKVSRVNTIDWEKIIFLIKMLWL